MRRITLFVIVVFITYFDSIENFKVHESLDILRYDLNNTIFSISNAFNSNMTGWS